MIMMDLKSVTTSSSDPSPNCAKVFVAFLAVELVLAFVTAMVSPLPLPSLLRER